jgi:Ca-activated chloride channel family protein
VSAPGCRQPSATRLVGALLMTAGAARPTLAQRQPVFQTEIGIVVLQATVKNGRGELVTGLEQSAFTVYENGKPQAITAFSRDEVPVSLGLVLDHSRSMRGARAQVEAAALTLARSSNHGDELFVVNFADKPAVDVPLTNDLQLLEAGISRVACIGGTALRDAVAAGEAYLTERARRERKVLVVVSDGCDNASAASHDEVGDLGRRSLVVLHAIGLLNPDDPAKAERGRKELDELCAETGGVAYFPRPAKDASTVALALARQIRSQYTIGYSPANQSLDGSYRKIRVVAKGQGRLSVRTRPGYRAVAGQTASLRTPDSRAMTEKTPAHAGNGGSR